MDNTEHAALRAVIVHETCDTIKQLQNELRREKQAHKRTRDEYESLKDCHLIATSRMIFQCDHCHKWTQQYEPERMHASVVRFHDSTCSSEEVVLCSDCDMQPGRCYSRWGFDCEERYDTKLHNYDGEHLAAVLIQLAWRSYRVDGIDANSESELSQAEHESELSQAEHEAESNTETFCEVCDGYYPNVMWFLTPHSYHPMTNSGEMRNLYSACSECIERHGITGQALA